MSDFSSSTVFTWTLKSTQSQPATESVLAIGQGTEISLADDSRKLVDAGDIKPGGKYYCESKKPLYVAFAILDTDNLLTSRT